MTTSPASQPQGVLTDDLMRLSQFAHTAAHMDESHMRNNLLTIADKLIALAARPATAAAGVQEIGELREGLGNIAVKVMDDRLMLKCCHAIDKVLAALAPQTAPAAAGVPSEPASFPPIKGAWIDGGYVIVTPAGSGPDKAPALKAAILAAATLAPQTATQPASEAVAFDQVRARTLLAHLWRTYDAAGTSLGRSHQAVVLEAAMSLLGEPDASDLALLDADSGQFINATRDYLSRKMAVRLGFPATPAQPAPAPGAGDSQ